VQGWALRGLHQCHDLGQEKFYAMKCGDMSFYFSSDPVVMLMYSIARRQYSLLLFKCLHFIDFKGFVVFLFNPAIDHE